MPFITASRAKIIATVLPAIASAAALIIAAFKPTGIQESAKAYDLLKEEVMAQRAEILSLHKDLAEINSWMMVWREYQAAHFRQNMQMMELMRQQRQLKNKSNEVDVPILEESVPPPVPKMNAVVPERKPLPNSKSMF